MCEGRGDPLSPSGHKLVPAAAVGDPTPNPTNQATMDPAVAPILGERRESGERGEREERGLWKQRKRGESGGVYDSKNRYGRATRDS